MQHTLYNYSGTTSIFKRSNEEKNSGCTRAEPLYIKYFTSINNILTMKDDGFTQLSDIDYQKFIHQGWPCH